VVHDLTVAAEPTRAVVQYSTRRDHRCHELAARFSARPTMPALPARCDPGQHDVVALGQPGHPGSHLLDDAGTLMTHHQRDRRLPLPAPHVQVAVAHPGRRDPYLHLAGTRFGQVDVDDLDGLAGGREHNCAHHHSLGSRITPEARGGAITPLPANSDNYSRGRCRLGHPGPAA
jgi:hypothetical protein